MNDTCLALQGMQAQRLRASLADRDYSQTRAVISIAQDLGATLVTAPAPVPDPSEANSVSLALADVVDMNLQSRYRIFSVRMHMQISQAPYESDSAKDNPTDRTRTSAGTLCPRGRQHLSSIGELSLLRPTENAAIPLMHLRMHNSAHCWCHMTAMSQYEYVIELPLVAIELVASCR